MKKAKAPAVAPSPAVNQAVEDLVLEAMRTYGLYTNEDRAIPRLEDGLKPSQRRLTWASHESKFTSKVKCAEIVGYTMSAYHPHGDAALYGALVGLVQDRVPLFTGQGNFGTPAGDPPASYRYTEACLSPVARVLATDTPEMAVVPTVPSYNDKRQQPVFLPMRLPLLFANSSTGVGVGLNSVIPGFNLDEITRTCLTALADLPESENGDSAAALLALGDGAVAAYAESWRRAVAGHVTAPDVGSCDLLSGPEDVANLVTTGRGTLAYSCAWRVEPDAKVAGGNRVLVTGLCPDFDVQDFLASMTSASAPAEVTGARDETGSSSDDDAAAGGEDSEEARAPAASARPARSRAAPVKTGSEDRGNASPICSVSFLGGQATLDKFILPALRRKKVNRIVYLLPAKLAGVASALGVSVQTVAAAAEADAAAIRMASGGLADTLALWALARRDVVVASLSAQAAAIEGDIGRDRARVLARQHARKVIDILTTAPAESSSEDLAKALLEGLPGVFTRAQADVVLGMSVSSLSSGQVRAVERRIAEAEAQLAQVRAHQRAPWAYLRSQIQEALDWFRAQRPDLLCRQTRWLGAAAADGASMATATARAEGGPAALVAEAPLRWLAWGPAGFVAHAKASEVASIGGQGLPLAGCVPVRSGLTLVYASGRARRVLLPPPAPGADARLHHAA